MQKLNCDCTQEKLCSQTSSVTTSYPPSKNHSIGYRAQTFQFIFKKTLVKESLPHTSLWRHCKTIHHSMDDSKCYIQSQFPLLAQLILCIGEKLVFPLPGSKIHSLSHRSIPTLLYLPWEKILIQSQSKVLNLKSRAQIALQTVLGVKKFSLYKVKRRGTPLGSL